MDEFEIIDSLKAIATSPYSLGLSDDAAVIDDFVLTKDVLSANVHFFENDNPSLIARKALRVNLSDLAAMGAKPLAYLMGLFIPQHTPPSWIKEFISGLEQDQKQFGITLIGGDTVVHNAPLAISITAIGKTKTPIKRSGAKAGDNIYVTGTIGDSFLGLQALKNQLDTKHRDYLISRYLLPEPRINTGLSLQGIATSMIDISDGLLGDLNHICKTSNVGAEIFSDKIPLSEAARDSGVPIKQLLSGGDDYELLFTVPPEKKFSNAMLIGKITDARDISLDGNITKPQGYKHIVH